MSWIWSGEEGMDYYDPSGYDVVDLDPDLASILEVGAPLKLSVLKNMLQGKGGFRPGQPLPRLPGRPAPARRPIHPGNAAIARMPNIKIPPGSDKPVFQQPRQAFTTEMEGICPVQTPGVVVLGASATATGTPQRPQYLKEFVIGDSIAPNWLINDIRVGAKSLFNFGGPVSAEVWSSRTPRQASWTSSLITPGVIVQVLVTNIGGDATFFASFHGPSYE